MSSINIDPTVYTSRTGDLRSAVENKTYDLLKKLGIGYTRIDHGPAMTLDDCAGVDALLGVPMCKNLFLCNRQETEFYLLMLPGGKQFKTSVWRGFRLPAVNIWSVTSASDPDRCRCSGWLTTPITA